MNANAKKWVEALRSGEFEQATGALRRGDKMCCLGVGCEIYRRETGSGNWTDSYDVIAFSGEDGVLPQDVADWLGVRTCYGGYDGLQSKLSGDNDSGKSFEEIADIIEAEPAGLFANG